MSARVIWTYDDYAALPDDGRRYELYEGELIEMTPTPSPRHQLIIGNLYLLTVKHVRRHWLGQVLLSPIDVILSHTAVLQPDLLYLDAARLRLLTERAVEGPPTLVVEVLSPSTDARDRGAKQALYAKYGMPYYWIVDPNGQTVQALRLAGESYEAVARLEGSAPASLPPLDGLMLDPAALWP